MVCTRVRLMLSAPSSLPLGANGYIPYTHLELRFILDGGL
jgi:hypothetical protein